MPNGMNMKFRSKSNNGLTNLGSLHCVMLNVQGKTYAVFPSKCSRFWKCFNAIRNSPEQAVGLTQK